MAKLLLKGGAELGIKDKEGRTAAVGAGEGGHAEVCELLALAEKRLQRLLNP